MGDHKLFEDELYRIGPYAFGRMRYRPVISLPESHARRLTKVKDYVEILGIILFILASFLFLIAEIGFEFPTIIGVFLIGFRASVIFLGSLVVARTVIRENTLTEITSKAPTSRSTLILDVQAQVRHSELHIISENKTNSRYFLIIEVQSPSGAIHVQEYNQQIVLPPRDRGEIERVLDLDVTESGNDNHNDILDVRIEGSRTEKNIDEPYMRELVDEFSIPVTISPSQEISSEVVEYEILSE